MINNNTKDSKIVNEIDYHEIIDCITGALDVKDPYTADHSKRVSNMAEKVCKILGLSDIETEKIHIAAHLHDIGKIGVPDAILNKLGKLTDEEWKKIKAHPKIGADILNKSIHLREIGIIVLHHHERFDGKGYPEGISGVDIPLGSRIIAICDSIDAMSMKRSYREAFNLDYCYNEIKNNLGKMYDPYLGQIVLENWESIMENSKFCDVG